MGTLVKAAPWQPFAALRRARGLACYLTAVGMIALIAPFAVLSGLLNARDSLGAWCKWVYGRCVFAVGGVRATAEGLDHVPRTGGFVLVANHESHFDSAFLASWIPRSFSAAAKQELFRVPVLGRGLRGLGILELDRSNRRSAMASLDGVVAFVRDGGVMVVFPEGHRSPTGALQEFETGAFVLALKAGVPIVPVGIAGTRSVLPPRHLIARPGPIHMVVGTPIDTQGLVLKDRKTLAATTREVIADLRLTARAALR